MTDIQDTGFHPSLPLRSPHVQSILASLGLRRLWLGRQSNPLLARSRPEVLRCTGGVRLLGRHTPQPADAGRPSKGLVMLIHGWEGHIDSSYVLSMATRLYRRGYDIFRLNLRDHGGTHHLNEEMFHACRLDEVADAVGQAAARFADGPVFLGGFSLGGNFALRVALRAPEAGIPLDRVFAISPVINPPRGLAALEHGPWLYRHYFLGKWRRSMARKQSLFPWRYDVGPALRMRSFTELTDFFVRRYTEFEDARDYLDGYALTGQALAALSVPTTVLASRDDPIVPVDDFLALPDSDHLELIITRFGGHCGFVRNLRFDVWSETLIAARLDEASGQARTGRREAG